MRLLPPRDCLWIKINFTSNMRVETWVPPWLLLLQTFFLANWKRNCSKPIRISTPNCFCVILMTFCCVRWQQLVFKISKYFKFLTQKYQIYSRISFLDIRHTHNIFFWRWNQINWFKSWHLSLEKTNTWQPFIEF